jgi:hypothetical protein
MITNPKIVEAFERNLASNEYITYPQALAIFDMLHHEAVSLGTISHDNIMDGIETTIRISSYIQSLPGKTK